MEKRGMQAAYPAGMFEPWLLAAECNSQMFEFMGAFVYSSLYKMMSEEDIPRVENALKRCLQEPGTVLEECVHMIAGDGYDTFIMSMKYHQDIGKYYIELRNLAISERMVKELERDRDLQNDFLTLLGGTFFTYHPEDDIFSLFWMNYEQRVTLYSMPFAQWEEEVLREGLVEERDASVFRSFCSAVRSAAAEQIFYFHGRLLSAGRSQESYRIKFMPRIRGGEKLVEGVWMGINDQTGDALDDYVTGIHQDSLTKLLDKQAINQYAEEAVEKGDAPAIVMVDIDHFKNVNDTYGHLFGDQVISAVADIIKRAVGSHGVAGRVGGDEFLIVMKDYGDELGLRNYLRGIRTNVTALFQDKLASDRISCSIGVARCGIDANNFRELYRIADRALYIAKWKGRNRYIIYKPELHGRFNTASDDLDMKGIRDSFYSEKDLRRFNLCLGEVVLHGREKLPALLEQTARILDVDRILVFWGEERTLIGAYPAETGGEEDRRDIFERREYRERFENDMLQISNTNMLEYSMPDLYAFYREKGIRSLMQHFLRGADGGIMGFVAVEECSVIRNFPKLAEQLFKSMCSIINAVLLRENA